MDATTAHRARALPLPAKARRDLRDAACRAALRRGASRAGRLAVSPFFSPRDGGSRHRGASAAEAAERCEAARRQRVLIVDDDASMRDSLAMVFENEGYEAMVAHNGAEALENLRGTHARPDLIVLDLMMPVMNGWDFRAAQLGDAALADIPTLVLTAAGRADSPVHGDLSMPHVLRKPVELDILLNMVERLLPGDDED